MGGGMSLVMTDLPGKIGIAHPMFFGIAIGLVGIILVSLAYPVYNRVVQKERARIAPEIIRLTDDLMK